MSVRMSELLWQAGGYTKLDGSYSLHESHLQKFAELIVKECANAIVNDGRLNDVRSAANGCVRTIREHFGVEE